MLNLDHCVSVFLVLLLKFIESWKSWFCIWPVVICSLSVTLLVHSVQSWALQTNNQISNSIKPKPRDSSNWGIEIIKYLWSAKQSLVKSWPVYWEGLKPGTAERTPTDFPLPLSLSQRLEIYGEGKTYEDIFLH